MAEHDRPNTRAAFAQDWARWTEFVETMQRAGMPLDLHRGALDARQDEGEDPHSIALVVFAKWLAMGGRTVRGNYVRAHAPESIRRRLTGVLAGWRAARVNYLRGVTAPAREWISGHENELVAGNHSTGRGQARVLEITGEDDDHAFQIALATHQAVAAGNLPSLTARRDLALIFLGGVAIAGRSAEAAFLDVADITEGERGLFVHVRRSKKGTRKPAVPYGSRDLTCPVLAWRRWQAASGIITGPAFRRIDKHGNLGGRLSAEACSDVVARAGLRAGITGLTFHSARAGFATAAARKKKSKEDIADQGGWSRNSTIIDRYIRAVRVWQENVLDGIGL